MNSPSDRRSLHLQFKNGIHILRLFFRDADATVCPAQITVPSPHHNDITITYNNSKCPGSAPFDYGPWAIAATARLFQIAGRESALDSSELHHPACNIRRPTPLANEFEKRSHARVMQREMQRG